MSPADDARMLEAILCALVLRAGGALQLPAREIAEAGNTYRLRVRRDDGGQGLLLDVAKLAAGGSRRPR
jgi:hypothetical protein